MQKFERILQNDLKFDFILRDLAKLDLNFDSLENSNQLLCKFVKNVSSICIIKIILKTDEILRNFLKWI